MGGGVDDTDEGRTGSEGEGGEAGGRRRGGIMMKVMEALRERQAGREGLSNANREREERSGDKQTH